MCVRVVARKISCVSPHHVCVRCVCALCVHTSTITGRVGRADRLGLALSFVGQHREKVPLSGCVLDGLACRNDQLLFSVLNCVDVCNVYVQVWYHKCANRGRGCSNTKPLDQGGCTIWSVCVCAIHLRVCLYGSRGLSLCILLSVEVAHVV